MRSLLGFIAVAAFMITTWTAHADTSFIPPTDADRANGWQWASPDQPISSQPVLFDTLNARFTVCYFSLAPSCTGSCYDQLKSSLCPGVDVLNPYPPVSSRTITLREWCGLARLMSGASFPPGLDNWVCGH